VKIATLLCGLSVLMLAVACTEEGSEDLEAGNGPSATTETENAPEPTPKRTEIPTLARTPARTPEPPPPPPPTEPPAPVQEQPAQQSCHPSYAGACLNPNASDYDCSGGSGNGPYYTGPVQVVGPDVFDLDRDNDGYGCE